MKLQFGNMERWEFKKNIFVEFCNIVRNANCKILHKLKHRTEVEVFQLEIIKSFILSELSSNDDIISVAENNRAGLSRMVNISS